MQLRLVDSFGPEHGSSHEEPCWDPREQEVAQKVNCNVDSDGSQTQLPLPIQGESPTPQPEEGDPTPDGCTSLVRVKLQVRILASTTMTSIEPK